MRLPRCPFRRPCVEPLEDRRVPAFLPPLLSPPGLDSETSFRLLDAPDLNADGRPDLIDRVYDDDDLFSLVVHLNNGDGTFGSASYLRQANDDIALEGVAAGDLNGDGAADLVVTATRTVVIRRPRQPPFFRHFPQLHVLLNNGDGTFRTGAFYELPPGEFEGYVTLGDFDGDGHLDAVTQFGFRRGNGDGTFADFTPLLEDGLTDPRGVDLDADGDLDLVSGSFVFGQNDFVNVLFGNGDGTFADPLSLPLAVSGLATGVATADVNGDGRPDLLARFFSFQGEDGLAVYLNRGGGSFSSPRSFDVPGSSFGAPGFGLGVAVTDHDRDGYPDAVVLTRVDAVPEEAVAVYRNNGDWNANRPALSVGPAEVSEGHRGRTDLTFTLLLSEPPDRPVVVAYQTWDGTAVARQDYAPVRGAVRFGPGEVVKHVTVRVTGDRLPEGDEEFLLALSPSGNVFAYRADALGVIRDDEPRLSIGDAFGFEGVGPGGLGLFLTFEVTLSLAYDIPVVVRYATEDNTAVARQDYRPAIGTLVFLPGETTKTISVRLVNDRVREGEETFFVDLFGETFAQVLRRRAEGFIGDND